MKVDSLLPFPVGHGTSAVTSVTLCHGGSGHEKSIPSLESETKSLGIRASHCPRLPQWQSTGYSSKPLLPAFWSHVFLKHSTQEPAWGSSPRAPFGSHRAALCFIYRWLEGTERLSAKLWAGFPSPWAELTPSGGGF